MILLDAIVLSCTFATILLINDYVLLWYYASRLGLIPIGTLLNPLAWTTLLFPRRQL